MTEVFDQEGAFRCEQFDCVMRKEVCETRAKTHKCQGCNMLGSYLRIDWAYELWGDNIKVVNTKSRYKSVIHTYKGQRIG